VLQIKRADAAARKNNIMPRLPKESSRFNAHWTGAHNNIGTHINPFDHCDAIQFARHRIENRAAIAKSSACSANP
jgi:hypothetical protein